MTLPDGPGRSCSRGSATGWDRATGENLWIAAVDGGYRAHDNAGRTWDFGPAGELLSTAAGAGTRVSLVRDEGRLVRLDHERGRSIELTWRGDLVVAATTSDGRHVDYGYDDHRPAAHRHRPRRHPLLHAGTTPA